MPSAEMILAGLRLAANDTIALAVGWHLTVVVAAVALGVGWGPSQRLVAALLSAPIASAAIVAFVYGNPFNGSLLGALAVALAILSLRFGRGPVGSSRTPFIIVGAAMVGFGLFYPHFLDRSSAAYLVAAPTGVIPCPTLSLVIGVTLATRNLQSKAWSMILALVGLFYGLFGMFRLGVTLDAGLVAGAAALLATVVRSGVTASRVHGSSASRRVAVATGSSRSFSAAADAPPRYERPPGS